MFFFLFSFIWAQFETPVTLSAIEKEPVRAGEVATIVVTAKNGERMENLCT